MVRIFLTSITVAILCSWGPGARPGEAQERSVRKKYYSLSAGQKKIILSLEARAMYQMRLEQYEEAAKLYSQGIVICPKCDFLYGERGTVYQRSGNYQRALEDYAKSLAMDPAQGSLLKQRGQIFETQKQYDRALKEYTAAIKVGGDAHKDRARTYMQIKNYSAAIVDYTAALAEYHDHNTLSSLHRDRARAYEALGKKDLAEKDRHAAKELTETLWGKDLSDYPKSKKSRL